MKKSIIPIIQASLAAIALIPLTSTLAAGCFARSDCKPTLTELTKGYEFDGKKVGIYIPAGKAHYQCAVTMPAKSTIDLQVAINHMTCHKPILAGKAGPQIIEHLLDSGYYISFAQMKHTPIVFTGQNIISSRYVLQCKEVVL